MINSLTGKQEMSYDGVAVDRDSSLISSEMEEWLRKRDNEEIADYIRRKKFITIALIIIIPIFAAVFVTLLK